MDVVLARETLKRVDFIRPSVDFQDRAGIKTVVHLWNSSEIAKRQKRNQAKTKMRPCIEEFEETLRDFNPQTRISFDSKFDAVPRLQTRYGKAIGFGNVVSQR